MNKLFAFMLRIFKERIEIEEAKKKEKTSEDVKPVQVTTVEQHEDSFTISCESIDLNKFNWNTMNTKYFTKEDILKAPRTFKLGSKVNYKDFTFKCNEFIKGKHGFCPIIITDEGNVYRGGHAGHERCTSFKKPEFAHKGKAKYVFVLLAPFEFNPKRTIIAMSEVSEVES